MGVLNPEEGGNYPDRQKRIQKIKEKSRGAGKNNIGIEGLTLQAQFAAENLIDINPKTSIASGYRGPKEYGDKSWFKETSDHTLNEESNALDIRIPGYEGKNKNGKWKFEELVKKAFKANSKGEYRGDNYNNLKKLMKRIYTDSKQAGFKDMLIEHNHIHLSTEKYPKANSVRFLSTSFPKLSSNNSDRLNNLVREIKLEVDTEKSQIVENLSSQLFGKPIKSKIVGEEKLYKLEKHEASNLGKAVSNELRKTKEEIHSESNTNYFKNISVLEYLEERRKPILDKWGGNYAPQRD